MAQPVLDAANLKKAMRHLARIDPDFARAIEEVGHPVLREVPRGFGGLMRSIVGQQVSVHAARSIWLRLEAAVPSMEPAEFLAMTDEQLRAVGLSGAKIATLRAVAAAVAAGLDLDGLAALPGDEAHARLTALHGIGPWTADVYLLFCLGHPDAFPSGDLAVQEAARLAYGLERRPDAKTLTALAESWRPWRGVAAKVLWAYYRTVKAREGAPT